MSGKPSLRDAADHLETDEDMAPCLDACQDEDSGNGRLVQAALDDVARARGMTQFARETRLTREGLSRRSW